MGRWIGYLTTIAIVSLALLMSTSRCASAEQAVLMWNASSDPSVTGYNVYVGAQSGDYQAPINAGNNTTYTVTGLSASQAYYFSVTAYSSSAESAFSQELVCYFITAATASNGQITPGGSTAVAGGGSQTYSIVPNSGYKINTVTVDGQQVTNPTSSYSFSKVSGSHTIAAAFSPVNYTITAGSQANGTISPSGAVSVTGGTNQAFTISPVANYAISEVQVDGTSVGAVSSYTFSNLAANHTISATFTAATYTITASAGSNGAISPSGKSTLNSGDNLTYTITPASGYQVAAITVDGTSVSAVSSYRFANVEANHTISAAFSPIPTYTISATYQGSGSISPAGAVSVNSGSSAQFAITANTGYQISNVVVDGQSVGAVSSYTFTNVTANHSILASFAARQYSISASVQGGGTISPAGTNTFSEGTNVSYSMTAAAGYKLAGVLVDGNEVSSSELQLTATAASSGASAGTTAATFTFSNVDGNHNIQAVFSPSFQLVADPGPDQMVKTGSTVTLDGLNSTGSGRPISSCKWTQVSGPAVKLSNPSSAQCTFTPQNVASAESLVFNLTVTNSAGASSSANCLVNVSKSGGGPSVQAGPNQKVSAYSNVTLDGASYSDSYGTIASYTWTQISGPTVSILNANTPTASFVAPDPGAEGTTLVFQLSVQDQYGLEARGQWTVNVVGDYQPPVATCGANISAVPMSTVTLDSTGSTDPAGSSDTYRWTQISGVPVTLSDPTSPAPTFTAPAWTGNQGSQLVFMVTVTNSVDQLSSTAQCTVSVRKTSPVAPGVGSKWTFAPSLVAQKQ